MTHTLICHPDGSVSTLTDNPIAPPLENVRTERWSEIIPISIPKRVAFRVLRRLFGEQGNVAAWTRGWSGMWEMRVLSTGYTARCNDREVLIKLEHELFR